MGFGVSAITSFLSPRELVFLFTRSNFYVGGKILPSTKEVIAGANQTFLKRALIGPLPLTFKKGV
jgi:hypothetical protein